MDLAAKVLSLPTPPKVTSVLSSNLELSEPSDYLKDTEDIKESIEHGRLQAKYAKCETADKRVAYVATQQLHLLQLWFLKALNSASDEDSNENKSIPALLASHKSQSPLSISDVDVDAEEEIGADEL